MEEYKTLREEINQASSNMFSALQWGAASISVVIAAGLTQWSERHSVVVLVFFGIVPLLSSFAMLLWLREGVRFRRAGDYISILEQKVAILFDEWKKEEIFKDWSNLQRHFEDCIGIPRSSADLSDPIAWEQWLRDMRGKGVIEGHLALIYFITSLAFPILMVFSYLIGLFYVIVYMNITPYYVPIRHLFESTGGQILLIMTLSALVIILTVTFSLIIARNINRQTQPIRRNELKSSIQKN
jgi:hypothetical protein